MSIESPHSDNDLLELLRIAGPLGVSELADAMEVTATAIRQRLVRLTANMMIQREVVRAGRGRPKHRYSLSEKGARVAGSNYTDLALALWQELNSITDEELRRQLLRRIARSLASNYAEQVQGSSPAERIRSLGKLLSEQRIPVSVDESTQQPTLTAHACPYPNLAEQDRSVCAMEKMLFSELVGGDVEITECRLDGGTGCRFQTG
jgi:DeoR family transcriptional regulator, suf operon transcriptional repressor